MTVVTGGIEVASDHLLPKIAKGITVPQVIKVLQGFAEAGIVTHAYLIYGFPGETWQDIVDSLDTLRQMFKSKILRSAFVHHFSLTAHSPIGRNPELFGLQRVAPQFQGFTENSVAYRVIGKQLTPNKRIFERIQGALEHFIEERHLDRDVREWFDAGEAPAPSVPADLVEAGVRTPPAALNVAPRLCWLGGRPRWSRGLLSVSCADGDMYTTPAPRWLADFLERCHPASWSPTSPPRLEDFEPRGWLEPFRPRGLVSV